MLFVFFWALSVCSITWCVKYYNTCAVRKVSSHVIWKIETFIKEESPLKITFEREKISDHCWDLGTYVEAADGDFNKGFCRVFWKVEERGRTVWGPKVPTLKGTGPSLFYVQCLFYLVSSLIMSLFSYYMNGYFSGEPSYVMKSKILPLKSNHMKWIFINHVLYKLNFWMYICSGMAKILAPLVNMIKEGCEN